LGLLFLWKSIIFHKSEAMKASLLLFALVQLVIGLPTITPPGCKKLYTDIEWPTSAEWKAAMPEVEVHKQTAGSRHPDYVLQAESYKDVQAAVQFCSKNNIRLVIITSGHDFLGRNDASSGLTLDVSLLKDIKVLESFTPTEQGVAKLGSKPNTIIPVPGQQAAVTFGVGWSTQRLNNALYPSRLFTIGAGHGSVSVAGGWGLTAGHGPLTRKSNRTFSSFHNVIIDNTIKTSTVWGSTNSLNSKSLPRTES
jgi:hypothetical protein